MGQALSRECRFLQVPRTPWHATAKNGHRVLELVWTLASSVNALTPERQEELQSVLLRPLGSLERHSPRERDRLAGAIEMGLDPS